MIDKEAVQFLLGRIADHLEVARAGDGALLLQDAETMIEDLALLAGLWPAPGTVSGVPRAHPAGAKREAPPEAPERGGDDT